jgi:hypothetical protein
LAHEEEKGLYKGRILIPPVPFHSWTHKAQKGEKERADTKWTTVQNQNREKREKKAPKEEEDLDF